MLLKFSKTFFAIVLLTMFFVFARAVSAATNISATTTDHWAWNDIIGWIDFYGTNSVNVFSNRLEGYASSLAGEVSLDCHTTSHSPPDICAQSNYQVTNNNNDTAGNLSNWAWNDQYGWISFDCHNNGGCGTGPGSSTYQVYIDGNTGNFNNYAWNDVIGWISFNCADTGCPPNYKVNTAWRATSTIATLDSATYDTGVSVGAQLNSVLWHGNQNGISGYPVKFQFAVGNSTSGSWTTNFFGLGCSTDAYYADSPDKSIKLDYNCFNNFRYFRYRVIMISNQLNTVSPRVDDVIVNWSP